MPTRSARELVQLLLLEGGFNVATSLADVQALAQRQGAVLALGASDELAITTLIQLDGARLVRISPKLQERSVLALAWTLHQRDLAQTLGPLWRAGYWSRVFADIAPWLARGATLACLVLGLLQAGNAAGAVELLPRGAWLLGAALSLAGALLTGIGRRWLERKLWHWALRFLLTRGGI